MEHEEKQLALARNLLECSRKAVERVKALEKSAQGKERERLEEILAGYEGLARAAEEEIRTITTGKAVTDEATKRSAEETLQQIREAQKSIRAYMEKLRERNALRRR